MKKLMRTSMLLSFILFGLTGCFYSQDAHFSKYEEPEFSTLDGAGYTKDISNQYFDKIMISGNIDATVENQQASNQLIYMGSPNMRKSLTTNIKNGTLYLEYGNYPSNVSARSPLRLDLKLSSPIRQITVEGDGKTRLRGDWVLSRLVVTGNAFCYAYWIDSTNFHVFAGDNAKIFLAGVASDLDIIARNNASIDARNLKTNNAYVRTQDRARVGVAVNNALSTYSSEGSDVYYYGDAPLSIHYLNNHGSALRMTGIDR